MQPDHSQSAQPSSSSLRRKILALSLAIGLLIFVVIIGIMLRAKHANEPLWLDEMHTLWSVDGSWVKVSWRAMVGNQSPVYFWLVKIFHDGFIAPIRTLSMIAGICLIPVSFWCAYRWTGSVLVSSMVSAIVACDPNFVFYSTEARPFVLLQLIAFRQIWLLKSIFESHGVGGHRTRRPDEDSAENGPPGKRPRWIWSNYQFVMWVIWGLLGFYLHYTYALFVAGQTIGLLAAGLVWGNKGLITTAVRAAVASILLALPMAGHCLEIWSNREDWSQATNLDLEWANIRGSFFVVCVLPLWGIAAITLLRRNDSESHGPSQIRATSNNGLFFVLISIAGMLVAAYAFGVKGILVPRYQQPTFILILISIAVFVSTFRQVRLFSIVCLIVMIGAFVVPLDPVRLVSGNQVTKYRNEPWHKMYLQVSDRILYFDFEVILLPGLVEDHRLSLGYANFEEYCKFPLTNQWHKEEFDEHLHVLPTNRPVIRDSLMERLRNARGLMIVIRGGLENAYQAHNFIGAQLKHAGFEEPTVRYSDPEEFGDLTFIMLSW